MRLNFICWLSIIFIVSGCSTTVRHSTDFVERAGSIRTIGLMPMDVKLFQLEAGGTTELIDEWNTIAHRHLAGAIERELSDGAGVALVPISEEELRTRQHPDWPHVKALMESVITSALWHGFDGPIFPAKTSNFDYSLGQDLNVLIQRPDIDAALFVIGRNYVETSGRKVARIVNFSASVAVAAALGTGVGMYVGSPGPNVLLMALVDRASGDLIWLRRSDKVQFNLLDKPDTDKMISWMLDDYFSATR